MAPYSAEQLNYFKFAFMVLNVFPNALRRVFVFMWDNLFAHTPGCQKWDDSTAVRSMLLAKEGGKTKHIATDKSYMEWDSAALFQGTLFSETFAVSDGDGKHRTLYQLYVKPLPNGEFHDSVQSPSGNTAETTALALDQLRLLRNALCQMSTQKIDNTTFDYYMTLAKDALTALGQNSIMNEDTGKLTAEAFPTAKIQQLEFELEREKSVVVEFKPNISHLNNEIKSQVENQVSSNKSWCSHVAFSFVSGLMRIPKRDQSDERKKYLNVFLSHLQEQKMDTLENLDVASQTLCCILCKEWISGRAVFFIFTSDHEPSPSETDKGLNSNCVYATPESFNRRDANMFLLSSKKSLFVLVWKTPRVLEIKELKHLHSAFHESVHMLFLQLKVREDSDGQDFFMELTLPTCGSDISSLCNQVDHLPLLVEQELSESNKECSNINSVVNHSLMSAFKPSMHVSYFSYRLSSQRQAEFVFDYLICSLHVGKALALTSVQDAVISSVQNEAFFFFLEPSCSNSSLSIIVEKESVTVKCRTVSQFELKCICSSVRTALENTMESLPLDVSLSLKSFLQLPCEENACSPCRKDAERKTSCSSFASETGKSCACAGRRDPEDALGGEQSKAISQKKDEANTKHADLGDDQVHPIVEPVWCILDYPGLESSYTTSDMQASGSNDVSLSEAACFDESYELNTSLLSVASASSLNSYPPSPSDPADEKPDFHPKMSPTSFDCSESDLTLQDKQLSVGGNMLRECHVMMSSYEEGLSSGPGEDCPDAETRKVEPLEDTVEGTPEEHKRGAQTVHPGHNTGPEPQGTPDPSISTVIQGSEKATVSIDSLIRKLQSDVAFYQDQCVELRQQYSQLEEKWKQSEEVIQQLQSEVGRQQFLECREKRSEKILRSSMEYVSEQSKSSTASGGTYAFTGMEGKLLGGAGPLQEPCFALQQRLLEISNSLSEAELRQMKFLARPKINWVRRAKIREGFELFEELETRGELSCTYVRELLEGIQRFDLLQKLDVPLLDSPGSASYRPNDERKLDRIPCKKSPGEDSSLSPSSVVILSEEEKRDVLPKSHDDAADEPSDGIHLQDNEENDRVSSSSEVDSGCNLSSGNSENSGGDTAVLPANDDCDDSSADSESSAEEQTRFPEASNGVFLSNESSSTAVTSSELSASSDLIAQSFSDDSTSSSCTSQSVCGSALRVVLDLPSDVKNRESSGDSSYNPTSSEEEILESSLLPNDSEECESEDMDTAEACTAQDGRIDEVSESSGDVWDGPMKPPHLEARCAAGVGKDVVDSGPLHGPTRVRSRPNSDHMPGLMKDALPDGDISVEQNWSGARSGVGKDSTVDYSLTDTSTQSSKWERLDARPRDRAPVKMEPLAPSLVDLVPQEVAGPVAHGVANAFLARHSQDKGLHKSLNQGSVSKNTSSQGASYVDGMMNLSKRNKAKPYFGECQADVHSRLQFPFPSVPGAGYDSRNAVGGYSYHGQTGLGPGPSSSYFTGSNFLVNGNFPSSSAFNSSVYNSFRSDFPLGRPSGMGLLDREPHLPLSGQGGSGLYTSVPMNQRFHSGMTGSYFGNGSLIGAAEPQVTPPVVGAQRHSGFNGSTSVMAPEREKTQTDLTANSGLGNQSNVTTNSDYLPSASTGNMARVDVQLGSAGLPAPTVARSDGADIRHESEAESSRTSQYALGSARSNVLNTSGDRVVQTGLPSDSSRVSRLVAGANTDANPALQGTGASLLSANTGGSMLNRDFGTDSVESTDNSLLALEQRVEEACALVERVLREREEREEFGREIERKEREIREQRARKRREREARELEEASRWPQQQEPVTGRSQWLCEHYQRHCRVRFPCCSHFYSCHRCHNNSKACDNEEAKASHATHLKCSFCQHEQEIGEDSGKCRSCGAQMSAYFCSICKHFTSVDKNPYHCKKCGICRIHKDKSFHCEVCNVCLDKRLEGKHKCRPDSGHDECCICLEDAFSGCQILPCSHKVHRECAIAMIQNGIRTCPVCRHPLYSPAPE